jgi:hypothetical protein
MAEKTIRVCDVCGEPAADTVTLKTKTRTLLKDLCKRHLAELAKGARRPTRGRPRATATPRSTVARGPRRKGASTVKPAETQPSDGD